MRFTEFQVAQQQLTTYLNKKIIGEAHGPALERRAQRLVDKWFQDPNRGPVLISSADLQITGCTLAFMPGSVKIKQWSTRFVRDVHQVHVLAPKALALGYVNNYQLFMTTTGERPQLVARRANDVMTWTSESTLIPPPTSPLFIALERAKTLGYLYLLKD